jgi:phage/plasmid-like protein (TIGR03299 family)
VPWAKVGTVIDDEHVTAEEAARIAGIDFDVELYNLGFTKTPELNGDTDGDDVDDRSWTAIPSRRAIVRQDTMEWLSICSTEYQVVQFREAFAFINEISPKIVAAGPLSGGRQAFMVVQAPEHLHGNFEVMGEADPHDMYVVLRTSHDLSKSIEVAIMSLRGRCMNQLTLPTLMRDVPQRWTVRHVGDPLANLEEAKKVLTRLPRYTEVIANRATQLATVELTADEFRPIMKRVIRKSMARVDDMVNDIIAMHDQPTVGFQGTGWGWVNTVSEYFQWGRPNARRTDQSVFTDSLDGDGANYTNKVMTALLARR